MEYPGSRKWFENKVKERENNPELFRASIGFDFIFYKDKDDNKGIKCLELNGINSGISGINNIKVGGVDKTHMLLVMSRSRDLDTQELYSTGDFCLERQTKYSYLPPPFLEALFDDKIFLPFLVPEVYRVRQLSIGELERIPFVYPEDTNQIQRWIVKPTHGMQGDGILSLDRQQLEVELISGSEFSKSLKKGEYIVQELIESVGAETDNFGYQNQSMRLLWDVRVFEDGNFELDFEAGYQRVSDNYVVNKALGAKSVELSEFELKMGRKAAEAILKRVIDVYKNQMQEVKENVIISSK